MKAAAKKAKTSPLKSQIMSSMTMDKLKEVLNSLDSSDRILSQRSVPAAVGGIGVMSRLVVAN